MPTYTAEVDPNQAEEPAEAEKAEGEALPTPVAPVDGEAQ